MTNPSYIRTYPKHSKEASQQTLKALLQLGMAKIKAIVNFLILQKQLCVDHTTKIESPFSTTQTWGEQP